MGIKLCYIKESYFIENSHFKKMLDNGNSLKQSKRMHLCMEIVNNSNSFYIPLRNNLKEDVKKFGRIGHFVPASNRKSAGLDYRYSLIINNDSYIEIQTTQKIPNSQLKILINDYDKIHSEFNTYLRGFIKATSKGRIEKEPLYRESSLINFIDLLIPTSVKRIKLTA